MLRQISLSLLRAAQPLKTNEVRQIKRWVAPTLRELRRRRKILGPEPPRPRSSYTDWNYGAELFAFQKRLGEQFDDALLRNALVFRSYIVAEEIRQRDVGIEPPEVNLQDNNALTKEGRQILGAHLDSLLKESLPKYPDDGISTIKNHLLSDDVLSDVASGIGLKDLILCADFPPSTETLARAFEALVAALDKSSTAPNTTRLFVRDFLVSRLQNVDLESIYSVENPLEVLENHHKSPLEPRLCAEAGKNTILSCYRVGLYTEDKKLVGLGWGETIEVAQEMAARDGLRRIYGEEPKPLLKLDSAK